MSSTTSMMTTAQRYDRALRLGRYRRLPAGYPRPQPTSAWPAENVALLERYRIWLDSSGASLNCIEQIYIPMAGHALGLNLKPHQQIDLDGDLERAMDFIKAKQLSIGWAQMCYMALNRFRRFLRQQRGQVEVVFGYPNLERYQKDLPCWFVEQMTRFQHVRQFNWRPARLNHAIVRFWSGQTRLWRWLFEHHPFAEPRDIKRQHVFDYIDHRLSAGYVASGINQDLRNFHAFLRFLQEQDYLVPQALLRIRALRQTDRLPRFLTDEQVCRVRDDLARRVQQARTKGQVRDALFDRAAFYLLWHGGLRLGEVEELRLEDLDLANRKLMVRDGKGRKDRTVYLTDAAVKTLKAYLTVRGMGPSDHVFLYQNKALCKDLIRSRVKAAGQRAGVKATPHRLRHTFATQLVNAGCRITSIQQLLGHRRLNSTMIYARVHDKTVAEDYYAAMEIIERGPEAHQRNLPQRTFGRNGQNMNSNGTGHLLALVDALESGILNDSQQELVAELRSSILALECSVVKELMISP